METIMLEVMIMEIIIIGIIIIIRREVMGIMHIKNIIQIRVIMGIQAITEIAEEITGVILGAMLEEIITEGTLEEEECRINSTIQISVQIERILVDMKGTSIEYPKM